MSRCKDLCGVFPLVIALAVMTAVPARGESVLVPGAPGNYAANDDLQRVEPHCEASPHTGLRLGGYLQMWWTLWEQAENGLYQPLTHDKAAEEVSGFSLRRGRLSAEFYQASFRGRISLELEGRAVGLLDAYGVLPLSGSRLELWCGQMKVPATYEVAVSSARLDFVTRTRFSRSVVDYSLSRSPSLSSPRFSGVRTKLRDLGIAIKGRIGNGRYFLMVGNGLGANIFIGGREQKQVVFTNNIGAHFYGVRVSYELPLRTASLSNQRDLLSLHFGGYASLNHHPNIVLDDERTVLDIERRSWCADARAEVAGVLSLTAMLGEGFVEDDFDNDGKDDYRYRGAELKAVARVVPDRLEIGFRYDLFADESYENGAVGSLHTCAIGITCHPALHAKIQLNYVHKMLDSDTELDLEDDLFIIAGQIGF